MAVTNKSNSNRGCGKSVWISLLVLSNILIFQLTYMYSNFFLLAAKTPWDGSSSGVTPHASSQLSLDFPKGSAIALPSIRVKDDNEKAAVERGIYGGVGDKLHLGGFSTYDSAGVSPQVWKYMIRTLGVKSILDVGCGRGISTWWFITHGLRTTCVEGSHDAVLNTVLPDPHTDNAIVEHDFTRGPWWPSTTVDAVWSVEFIEHVSRQFLDNYIQSFRKAALIFATHSSWGGWHHMEVHSHQWWINKFEMQGFRYSEDLTNQTRSIAQSEKYQSKQKGPNGEDYYAEHVIKAMQVFINPVVAALPQHAHLLADHGCYDEIKSHPPDGDTVNRECGTGKDGNKDTKLAKSFYPLELNETMDKEWFDAVKRSISKSDTW